MLIVLHIRLFLMSYDSGIISLGGSEINYDFFWQNFFSIKLFICCFLYWVAFPIVKDAFLTNAMFH